MKTLSCTATLHDQRNTSWVSGYARQGKYTTILHRGLIVFPQLANNVMKDKNILDIKMYIECSGAGAASSKKAQFYKTTKTTSGGSATSWIASGNAVGTLSGVFYNKNLTFASLKSSDVSLFNNLKAFFESGGQALGMYANESVPSGRDYSANYMSFTKVIMTISYEDGNIRYYDGAKWVGCKSYYHNGNMFVPCDGYRYDGTMWTK